MTTFERRALSLLVLAMSCAACARYSVQRYDGIPPDAAALTYCDGITGHVRSALDASLFRLGDDGHVEASAALPEILAHEATHRDQLAQREKDGVCFKPLSWGAMLDIEVQAYCAGFRIGLLVGRAKEEIAYRYWLALSHQFAPMHPEDIRRSWARLCPQYPLGES